MRIAEEEAWVRVHDARGLCMAGLVQLHDPNGSPTRARAHFFEAHAGVAAFLKVWEEHLTPDQVAFLDGVVEETGRRLNQAKALLRSNA